MSFFVGQSVRCVGSDPWMRIDLSAFDGPAPRGGGVYVVTGVEEAFGHCWLGIGGFENSWVASAFRPIVEEELGKLREIAAHPSRAALVPAARQARDAARTRA